MGDHAQRPRWEVLESVVTVTIDDAPPVDATTFRVVPTKPSLSVRRLGYLLVAVAASACFAFPAQPSGAQGTTSMPGSSTTIPGCNAEIYFDTVGPVFPGDDVVEGGSVCEANVEVVISIDGMEVGRGTSDAQGNISIAVHIPGDLSLGLHTIAATVGQNEVTSREVNIGPGDLYDNGPAGFIVEPISVQAGGAITIRGQGCDAGDIVSVTVRGEEIGSGITRPDGTFEVTASLPTTSPLGQTTLVASCTTIFMSNVVEVVAIPMVAPHFTG